MPYSPELIRALAARHGLGGEVEPMPDGGMVNEAWQIGEHYVLRICKTPEYGGDEAAREAAVVPLVIENGIRAPELVAWGPSDELAPTPYTIYRKASGVLLGYCPGNPGGFEKTYREIGRETARLHRIEVSVELRPLLRGGDSLDVWKSLAKAQAYGSLSQEDGRKISDWLDLMKPKCMLPARSCLIHKDIHPWNLFVDPDKDRLEAIIDWGDASLGDPALEFSSMPLEAVPAMLEGYLQEGGEMDEGFMARSLWTGVSLALFEIRELPVKEFERQWWRMPAGGWGETMELIGRLWPEFV